MDMSKADMPKIIDVLINLLADQEGIEITYELIKEEPEKTA